uniref:Ribonuclease H-like domain, reverse transcriptase, RNA-dependent DNA polymerase n=1 Tax=Tanacetum cinerariifolium TaxID=118510 RepID=A0A6L2MTC1_TANCI|nr:ribonuclease H-like domain, reverse transcriptase, RNA-dependent DNA polymerase [Tanacetum cinerariifolium]
MEDMLPLGEEKMVAELLVKELFILILLGVPRRNNMYSVDMKNIVPKESLTCLDNLMRGLPSKRFENDQTCVACLKGKQHKASSTKDETSGILKKFITEIENLVDKKVKVIRSDNGTEFKKSVLNDFCAMKGIKREFSIARTPRVLVVKPHNKTLYELFRGRSPALRFMKPFGCHVTILNTLDHLGKFDGKAYEGYFVRYAMHSTGLKWLFDIDMLTESMNYLPVSAGTNSNDFVDSRIDAHEKSANSINDVNTVGSCINTASTDFDTCSPNIKTVSPTVSTASPEATHADFFSDQPKGDMSNINTTYQVLSTLNTRIHKDHSLDLVIGDVQSGGYTHEEGIDYDEVFAPVARIEAIRPFLAYASFMRFMVYQMDVKSDFLYERIEEEDCKLSKNKMEYLSAMTANTPVDTENPLVKDADGDDVDVHLYRSMIGSLMYLTTSRPYIMYAVYVCVRFQVTPKVLHLHAVKRIFRSLKGHSKFGLWYPKVSLFELVASPDSDYAGASLDRKSTT